MFPLRIFPISGTENRSGRASGVLWLFSHFIAVDLSNKRCLKYIGLQVENRTRTTVFLLPSLPECRLTRKTSKPIFPFIGFTRQPELMRPVVYRIVSRFFVAFVLAALTTLLPLFTGCGGCQDGSLSQPAPIPLPDKTVQDNRSTEQAGSPDVDTAEQRVSKSEGESEDGLPAPGGVSSSSAVRTPKTGELGAEEPETADQTTTSSPPPLVSHPVKTVETVPPNELPGPAPQALDSEAMESVTAPPEATRESPSGPVRNISPVRNIPPVRNISPVRSIPPVRQVAPVETEPSAMQPAESKERLGGGVYRSVVFARVIDEEEPKNEQEKSATAVSESSVPENPVPENPVPETLDHAATSQNGEEPMTESASEKSGATPDKETAETASPKVSPATVSPTEAAKTEAAKTEAREGELTTNTEEPRKTAPLPPERRSEDGPGPRQDYSPPGERRDDSRRDYGPPGERRDDSRRDYGSRREYGPPGERRGESLPNSDRERMPDGDAASTDTTKTGDTAAKTDDADAPSGWATKKHIRFNFQFQPWKDVIPWFAELSELSLERTNFPSGTLNLTDPQLYTAEEALDILNSVLLFREYTLIRKGRMLVALYLPDGIPPNLLDPISPEELNHRGRYELVRVLFDLNRTTPEVIQAEIEKMLGPQGSIVTLPKSQQVLVTETGGNLRAIRDIIKRIDDPNDTASSAINMVEMRNMSADEALAILLKLLGIEENDASLRTAVDATGSKIWLTGRADMIERAREIITTIDTAYDTAGTKREGEPQFLIYETGTADPNTVLAVLQTLLATSPDPDRRLSIDPRTGGIALLARIPDHNLAKATIEQMQLSARTVTAIPLGTLSPSKAVELLKSILTPAESSSTSTTKAAGTLAPATIEADTANRRLIVYGTPVQIEEIRNILAAMGETGSGKTAKDDRSVRMLPMPSAAAAMVLEQLPELWSAVQPGNEIKVVPPSAMIPSRSTTDLTPNRTPASPRTAPANPGTSVPVQERPAAVPETDEQRIQRIIREHYRTNGSPAGPTTYYRHENQTGLTSPVYRSVVWTRVADDEDAAVLTNAVPAGNADDMAARLAALEAENQRMRALLQLTLERLQAVEKAEPQSPTTSAAKPELPTSASTERTAPLPPEATETPRIPQISPEALDRLPPELRERIRRAQAEFRNRDAQTAARQPAIPGPAIPGPATSETRELTSESPTTVPASPFEAQTVPAPPVVVSASPGGLMITSEDTEALTRLEDLIRMLSDESVLGKQMKVYYIKNATAEVVAQTLKSIMGTGSYSTDDASLPNIESEDAAAVVALLEAGMSYEATSSWSVTVEPRLNALLIQANPVDHWTIEKLLPLLDQENPSGNDIKRLSKTRMIPLFNMPAEDALTSVEKIFAANLESATGGAGAAAANRGGGRQQQQQGQRGNMPMPPMIPGMPGGPGGDMMQQIMARMGGGRGGAQTSTTLREEPQKMTLAVDNRSNSLIVYSPEALFLEVETVVRMLDDAAAYQEIVSETVILKNTSPAMIRDMFNNLGSSAISIGTSSSTTTSGAVDGTGTTSTTNRWGTGGTGGFQFRPGGTGGGFPFGGGGGMQMRPGGTGGGTQMRPGGTGGGGMQMRPGGMGGGR